MSKLKQLLFPDDLPPAILALADGRVFHGYSLAASGHQVGEVVFNTAMTGYQEILSDPSYAGQLVTLTYPHIGNTGINEADNESTQIQAAGLIVREYHDVPSSWRSEKKLSQYLKEQDVIAITGIDTRELTNYLREHGAMKACLMTGDYGQPIDEQAAINKAQEFGGLTGLDLAQVVTVKQQENWQEGRYHLATKAFKSSAKTPYKVVCYDFGIKQQIMRILHDLGCQVTLVPAKTPAAQVLAMKPDGVFMSNGPGDPAACDYAIQACREFIAADMPFFGICLGHQILALALGGSTEKMKYGHHGANHPVADEVSKQVMITSQNHSFCVSEETLPSELVVTHRSLFDHTIQGFRHQNKPVYAFQGHPEASPGPHDALTLFDGFIDAMNTRKQQQEKAHA
ncbi:MAG: glutamine-hydrolyzing carbamoyl-phosphate synthase small subunit [Proteobacteria bacterium]|nr:glutamine-hydrolyzing carbamoyl-phosphate synthase small subunit [Pseudomonadota bacterium]